MEAKDIDQPDQFPHPTAHITWLETHISTIILTGDWVYKIKKPVDFGFLDFSTLEKRKHYCEEELRLNRRTAPDLYVSVEPLCSDQGRLNFVGQGKVVDYAVKMRQFDPDALLLNRMESLLSDWPFLQNLGYELAAFHEQAKQCAAGEDYGSAASVLYPVEENFRQIKARQNLVDGQQRLEQIEQWSLQQWQHLEPVFDARKKQGRVKECHGDLHLQNIALINAKAVMFDCIEFNERFRWIDVANDLAFLLMDLEIHNYQQQANAVLNSYLEYSGDYQLLAVLDFYRVYRAMVRAKVAVLKLEQTKQEEQDSLKREIQQYFDYAQSVIHGNKPCLVLTCGVSGSGKSTLARQLAGRLQAIQLRSDVVRKQLAGLKPLESSSGIDPHNPNALYSSEYTRKTLDRLKVLAEQVIRLGYAVIVDATFITRNSRLVFQQLAADHALPYFIVHMDVPHATLKQRIQARQSRNNDASEAGVEIMEKQLKQFEPFDVDESGVVLSVSANVDDPIIEQITHTVRAAPEKGPDVQ